MEADAFSIFVAGYAEVRNCEGRQRSHYRTLQHSRSLNTPQPPNSNTARFAARRSCDGAFLYFLTDEVGFGPEFLGKVKLVTSLAGLIGVVVYNR